MYGQQQPGGYGYPPQVGPGGGAPLYPGGPYGGVPSYAVPGGAYPGGGGQQPPYGAFPGAPGMMNQQGPQAPMSQNPLYEAPIEARRAGFYANVRGNLSERNYIIIVDKSGSMDPSMNKEREDRWAMARPAVESVAAEVVKVDADGATLLFFSSADAMVRCDNMRTAMDVMNAFGKCKPGGSTDLAGVLRVAFGEHFNPKNTKPGYPPGHGPTTILVLTDGEPDDKEAVKNVIRDAASKVQVARELSVSVIQIGTNEQAAYWMDKELDDKDGLGAKVDIVDVKSWNKIKQLQMQMRMPPEQAFAELVFQSICD